MYNKFTIALILGAATVVNAQYYRPQRRYGPSRPTGPSGPSSSRYNNEEGHEQKENFELNLDFDASPHEHEEYDGRYTASRRGGLGYQQQQDIAQEWPIDYNPYDQNNQATDVLDTEGEEIIKAAETAKREEENKPEGWYSASSKFSPIIIPYVPATFNQKHIYGICNLQAVDGKTEAGFVKLV